MVVSQDESSLELTVAASDPFTLASTCTTGPGGFARRRLQECSSVC